MIKTSFPDFQKVLYSVGAKIDLYREINIQLLQLMVLLALEKEPWQKNYLNLDLIILIVASYIEFMLMNFKKKEN